MNVLAVVVVADGADPSSQAPSCCLSGECGFSSTALGLMQTLPSVSSTCMRLFVSSKALS